MILRSVRFSILSLILLSANALATDTTIRILAVADPSADVSLIPGAMSRITSIWNISAPSTPVTITIANGLVPVPLPVNIGGGSFEAQLASATALVGNPFPPFVSLREQYAADIIIVFVDEIELPISPTIFFGDGPLACGVTWQDYWTSENPPAASLQLTGSPAMDLRGQSEFFVALVSTGEDKCQLDFNIAAHEFGHLLGAGHERILNGSQANNGEYLYPTSHAELIKARNARGTIIPGSRTVMTTPDPAGCGVDAVDCPYFNVYSNGVANRNIIAIGDTALSVANYWIVPQTLCDLERPFLVTGQLAVGGICDPPPETRHVVSWQMACTDLVTSYKFYAQAPAGTGNYNLFGILTPPPILATDVLVDGGSSNIKIAACRGSGCTQPSSSFYTATDFCDSP